MSSPAPILEQPRSESLQRRYDIGIFVPGDPASHINVEIHWPTTIKPRSQVLFCVPGGGMNRLYYDLVPDREEGSESAEFSFAQQMAERGFVSVLVDPPGLGNSDRPQDSHSLSPELVAGALARVHSWVCEELREGKISHDLSAMPDLKSIGVGHSMGGLLTLLQQDHHKQHQALVVLGFGIDGLPQFLSAEAKRFAGQPDELREHLPRLTKDFFPGNYPVIRGGGGQVDVYGSAGADARAIRALHDANDVMLPMPAYLGMFPGSVAPECARLEVPVYLGLGDRDMLLPPEDPKAIFPASPAITVNVLPETGHSHFLFASRTQLFDGIAQWVDTINI